MKSFALYTAARLGLFVAAFALVWLVAFSWLEWNDVTALWTALIALVVSSVASLLLLGGIRARFASQVQTRAERMAQRVDEARRAEDVD